MQAFASILAFTVGLFYSCTVYSQSEVPPLTISHLTGDLYTYTTHKKFDGSMVPSNSMYIVTEEGVVMFDTPWDSTQYKPLLDSIKSRQGKEVVMAITTHAQEDRSGGLGFLRRKGVTTYTSRATWQLLKQYPDRQAAFFFENDTIFSVGEHTFSTFYGGAGHTEDNIVIWFSEERVLFGGCLIKSAEARSLGNTAEAKLEEWPLTLKKVQQKFPQPLYIIPGHGKWNSTEALNHTLLLLSQ